MASAIESQYSGRFINVKVEQAQLVGTFDVFAGDELVYSKKKTGRLPQPGEVEQLLLIRIV